MIRPQIELPFRGSETTSTVAIFGVGDVVKRKLGPAFLYSRRRGWLSPNCRFVCFANKLQRTNELDAAGKVKTFPRTNEWLRRELQKRLEEEPYFRDIKAEEMQHYLSQWRFYGGNPDSATAHSHFASWLREAENPLADVCDPNSIGNHLTVVFATPPEAFQPLALRLIYSPLFAHDSPFQDVEVVVEKPFANDVDSARDLNKVLHACFPSGNGKPDEEGQRVYAMRHYLNYPMVLILQSHLLADLVNPDFPVEEWSWKHITGIQVWSSESTAVGRERLDYYVPERGQGSDCGGHVLSLGAVAVRFFTAAANTPLASIQGERHEAKKLIKLRTPNVATFGQYRGFAEELKGTRHEVLGAITPTWFVWATEAEAKGRAVPMVLGSGKMMGRDGTADKWIGYLVQRGTGRKAEWLQVNIWPEKGIWHHRLGDSRTPFISRDVTSKGLKEFIAESRPAAFPYAAMFQGIWEGTRATTEGPLERVDTIAHVEQVLARQRLIEEGKLPLFTYGDCTAGPVDQAARCCLHDLLRPYGIQA